MKLPRFILYLLLMASLMSTSFAFNADQYLYPEENVNDISNTHFTLDSIKYTLVTIDMKSVFLLKDGKLMEDEQEISDTLYSYYKDNSYPTKEEVNELFDLIAAYNNSRFDNGTKIAGMAEEKLCLANLLMLTLYAGKPVDLFPCYDDESCEYTAWMFCSAVGEQPFSMCRPNEIVEDMKFFSYASRGTEKLMGNFTYKLLNYDEDSLYSDLQYIQSNLAELKGYAENIEASVFQTSTGFGQTCHLISMDATVPCYQICGKLDVAQELIPMMEDKVDELMIKMESFATCYNTSAEISTETQERLLYKINTELRAEYLEVYEPLYEEGSYLLFLANDTVSNKVINQSLKSSMYKLQALTDDINNSIDNLNFTKMDNKLDDYADLLNETKTDLNASLTLYNDTMKAKSEAEYYLFLISIKSLDPSLEEQILEIQNQKEELDKNLSKTVPTASKMQEINVFYHSVENSLSNIWERQKENILFLQMRGFARNINTNVNNLLSSALGELTYQQRKEYSEMMPLALSGVNLVAMGCVGAFVFLIGVSRIDFSGKKRNKKLIFAVGGLVVFGLIVLIFSVGLYFYLDKTANSAEFGGLIKSISSYNKTAIYLNLSNVGDSASESMQVCAAELKEEIEAKNKTVDLYMRDTDCTKNGEPIENTTAKECITIVDAPIIYLGYSSTEEKPKITAIFLNQLTLKGDKDYYDECIISLVFNAVEFEEPTDLFADVQFDGLDLNGISFENITNIFSQNNANEEENTENLEGEEV